MRSSTGSLTLWLLLSGRSERGEMNLANLFLGAEISVFLGGFWKPFMVKSLPVSRCRPNQSCLLQPRRIPLVPEAHTLIFSESNQR